MEITARQAHDQALTMARQAYHGAVGAAVEAYHGGAVREGGRDLAQEHV